MTKKTDKQQITESVEKAVSDSGYELVGDVEVVETIESGWVYSFTENGKTFEGHRERFEDAVFPDRFVVFPAHGMNGYSCPLDRAVLFEGLTKVRPA